MISGSEALARLREGNRRFVADQPSAPARSTCATCSARRRQEPFAIILGCSDSRVPAELVFDQGFGDLFVIRVAGNIVAPSQIGSVEFAASRFGTRLVVVMGHTQCGAITATLEELQGHRRRSRATCARSSIVSGPPVASLLSRSGDHDPEALVREAVRANVRASVDHLQHGSELLERLTAETGLLVVGAEYSLETGVVSFFGGVE